MQTIEARHWIMRGEREVALEPFDFDISNLGPREIATRTDFTAVSPGTECANYLALDPDVKKPGMWCSYPWVPGYSGVGHIIAKGEAVGEYEIGDRVVGLQVHSSHYRLSANSQIRRAHPQVDAQIATYTRLISIATMALQATNTDALATAGVWGLGTIGNLVAQLLAMAGYRTVGIDPIAQRRELAARCGIAESLDPTAADFGERVLDITHGEGFNIGADTTGQSPVTIDIPEYLSMRSQLILMTHWRSQPPVDGNKFMHNIFRKGMTLRGALEGSFDSGLSGHADGGEWMLRQQRKLTRIGDTLAAGKLNIEPLISHRVKPEQCKEVYEGLCFDRANWWGAVVDWR